MPQNKHRLDSNVKPIKYDITITPNLGDFSFVGEEVIQILLQRSTKSITLHSADLQINSAELIDKKSSHKPLRISTNSKAETISFHFSKQISGTVKFKLKFTGSINDQLRGFYRSKYHHNGKEKHIATTQFEATDARRMFPCFDEPSHKAIFKLSVVVPKHVQVISNTTEASISSHEQGIKIVRFEPSPKMSTYLLALIIGEFEHLAGKSKNGVKIRVHTPRGKKTQAKFALDVTKKALDYLENYFGIKYPLPVLDLIAIPDFSAGAMENWGAITFKETALLIDDQNSSFLSKQRVAEVVAHELVHQWFGNLVTMEWWTHLWLNESFATYMAYQTVDHLFPEWNFWTKFILNEQSYALQADSLLSTQPVEVEVKHPDEINEQFNPAIVYAKGASVLRMLANYIGEDNFRKGLALYLRKHSYKNTSSIHLWDAFEQVSKMPVKKFMKEWTTNRGFPVLSATIQEGTLKLTQEKFSFLKNNQKYLWHIPLFEKEISSSITLTSKSKHHKISNHEDFTKLNLGEKGFYIVNYSISMLARLLPLLEDKTLSSADRLAIIRNCLMLVKSGRLGSEIYIELLKYVKNDNSYIVWSEADDGLHQLAIALSDDKVVNKITKLKVSLFGNILKRLGFSPKTNEPENDSVLRGLAFLEAGLSGQRLSIKKAKELFNRRLKGGSIPADLRTAVYSIVSANARQQDLNRLITLHSKISDVHEKQQLLYALTHLKHTTLQKVAMRFFLSDEVRNQDKPFVLAQALANPKYKKIAWEAIQKNWNELTVQFSGSKLLGTILKGAKNFNSNDELKSFDRFIKINKPKGVKLTLKQVRERILVNIQWRKRDEKRILKYLP